MGNRIYRNLGHTFWFGDIIIVLFNLGIVFLFLFTELFWVGIFWLVITYLIVTKNRVIYLDDIVKVITYRGLKSFSFDSVTSVKYGGKSLGNPVFYVDIFLSGKKYLFEAEDLDLVVLVFNYLQDKGVSIKKFDLNSIRDVKIEYKEGKFEQM